MKETNEEIIKAIKECLCRSDICRKFGWCIGGGSYKKINALIKQYNLDISHFQINKSHLLIKYPKVEKICPVCNKSFITQIGKKDEKTVCSKSCSNTLFRSGPNNGNWKPDEERGRQTRYYRQFFDDSDLVCRRCQYNEFGCAIDIHHIDENRHNNEKENLIPLCSNCHRGLHNGRWQLDELRCDN